LIKLTGEGAASSGRDKAEVAREIGITWLLAGGSCNNLPDTDYSTFDLFSEGDMMVVTDRPIKNKMLLLSMKLCSDPEGLQLTLAPRYPETSW
jgi:hypothetical protein